MQTGGSVANGQFKNRHGESERKREDKIHSKRAIVSECNKKLEYLNYIDDLSASWSHSEKE